MKTLVTVLALAVLVVVLLMQLGPGEPGGAGLPVEGTTPALRSDTPAELDPVALDGALPEISADGRQDAAPVAEAELVAPRPEEKVGFEIRFFGRAVADEDGKPIPRAEVRVGSCLKIWEAGRPPEEFELPGELVATTDADGRFELAVSSREQRFVALSADGRAPGQAKITREHSARDQALEIRLPRAARLSGIVIDSRAAAEPLRVRVEASTGWMMQSPSLEFFGGEGTWTTEVDSSGSFSFESLPPRTPLRITVLEKREVAMRIPSPMILDPGEHREVEWRLGSGSIVHGKVVDENDNPMPQVVLWLLPASETFGGFLEEELEPTQREESDAQGSFCFSDLSPGEWVIGPAPVPDRAGSSVHVTAALDEPPIEILVRSSLGEFLSGRVLDPDGNGVANAFVSVYGLEEGGWRHAQSKAGGEFQVGPLLPGRYRLTAAAHGSKTLASSESVEARTGDEEVLLRLTRGGSVVGRVIDVHTGQPVAATLSVHSANERGYSARTLPDDGEFDVGGLNPGAYHLIARTEDGRVGSLRHVQVGADSRVKDLEIPVDRGGRVRVSYRGPLDRAMIFVEWNEIQFQHDTLLSGMEKTLMLPLGEVTVHLKGYDRTGSKVPPPVLFEREQRVEVTADEIGEVAFEIEE